MISITLMQMHAFHEEVVFDSCVKFLLQLLIALDPKCRTLIEEWVSGFNLLNEGIVFCFLLNEVIQ
jgi:hypothetical protein